MFSNQINDDIHLKLLETRFADELFALSDKNRDYLREWLPWLDATVSVEQTRNFIQSTLKAYADNNGFNCGIFYKGRIAGCIGLHGIDWINKKTSIGYWLGADFQGQGIMTLACKAVIDYVFNDLSLNRVEIRAAEHNSKSRAIPVRLNFVYEGKVRQAEWLYDHYVDHMVYGLLKEDWNLHLNK
ncbi:GNAT family N-acetyltransferase [Paenibacillus sedimenti]|uniref:GNAT family N-acetyltransferase n=1 Tax=Paenibacillus sedimenti TaxID=2770274 RepID=A0A926KM70_9BACL|nr:GNAT family protein [Paenibacillus sedimenti]MBD0380235.1 GNAT family N-acetyltransferase [Paenibacillus sedimenti]